MREKIQAIIRSPYTILTLLFLVQFLFLSPFGEFPLNDDWVHTDTIRHWAQTGEFRLMPFAGPMFYVPILYGTALTSLFGFSFSLLRLSTLAFTLGTILLSFALVFELTKNKAYAFVAALAVWLQPIIFSLSYTFMTDIPFLFFVLVSLFLYVRGFSKRHLTYIFFGSIIAVIATYTRQLGILLLLAAGLFALTQRPRYSFKQLCLVFGIPGLLFLSIYAGLYVSDLLPGAEGDRLIQGVSRQLGHMRWWSFYIPLYLGWFLLPLTVGYGLVNIKTLIKQPRFWIIQGLLLTLVLGIRSVFGLQFPYVQNIFTLTGLGPANHVLSGSLGAQFRPEIYALFTIAASLSLGVLIEKLIASYTPLRRITPPVQWLVYGFGLLYVIPIWLLESFDRYLIPLFIVAIIALYTEKYRFSILASVLPLLLFALISISGTYQYLDWQSTKWQESLRLQTTYDIPTAAIDAGYEWTGWHDYWNGLSSTQTPPPQSPWYIERLTPHNTREFVFSWEVLDGYEVLRTYPIAGYGQRTMYLLQSLTNSRYLPEEVQ